MPNHIRFILLYLFLLIASPAMSSPYHGDHLGSAAWITEGGGKPMQYMHYLPYGQLLANQTPGWYDERFKFIGKERDEESGYDFFGARYYISPFLHWMSVDPLVDKYLGLSPYAYCGWNPVKFVDPDGRKIVVGSWCIIWKDKHGKSTFCIFRVEAVSKADGIRTQQKKKSARHGMCRAG